MKQNNYVSIGIGILWGISMFLLGKQVVPALFAGLLSTFHLPLPGTLADALGLIGGVAAVGLLAWPGFQSLPEVSLSIISLLGQRIPDFVFSEGPAWRPPYICKFLTESIKIVTFDFPGLVCMSKDNQEVTVDGAVQCRVSDINQALEVADFRATLEQGYKGAVRVAAHGRDAEDLPGSKNWVAEMVRNGGSVPQPTADDPNATVALEGLEGLVEGYGRKISSVSITEIRLSPEYAKQLENQKLEDVQATAEEKDTDTLIRNFTKAHDVMGDKGVPGSEVLAALQGRRGYSKNIHVSGGSPVERAAAILGDALSGGTPAGGNNQPSSPPAQGSGGSKNIRRRKS